MNKLFKYFSKTKTIPLVRKGKPTGQWVEFIKNDETYHKLIKVYGKIPKEIEVVPINK